MRTQLTIDVEIEQLTCCRCGRTELMGPVGLRMREPFEMQHAGPGAAPWRTDASRYPEGWHRWTMPGADEVASCPDCWTDVERSGRAFLQLVRVREPFNRND